MQIQVLNTIPAQKLGAITTQSQAQRLVLEVNKQWPCGDLREDPGMMNYDVRYYLPQEELV